MRASLPKGDYDFQVIGRQGRTLLQPLGFGVTHIDGKQVMKTKLPNFNGGDFYALDRFEVEVDSAHTLSGVNSILSILPSCLGLRG
jgi:hypothetical protein